MMWEPTLFSRLGWSFKLFGRTIIVQLVVGLAAIALSVPGGILAPVAPVAGVFIMVVFFLLLGPWMIQVLTVAFAHSMAEGGFPPLLACLRDGLGRLPVAGNAMLLLMVIAVPIIIFISLLGLIHPLLSLLGIPVFWWFSLRVFSLFGVVAMEELGPWEACKRSWQISNGFVARILGNALLLAVVFLLLGFVLGGVSWFLGLAGVAQQLAELAKSSSGVAPDPMLLLMSQGLSALLPFGILIIGALFMELLMMAMMMAYSFFFYVEQKMVHDEAEPKWQPASMADRKQWTIYLTLVAGIALIPTLAMALNPVPVEPVSVPPVVKQQASGVRPAPPEKRVGKNTLLATRLEKPAVKKIAAPLAVADIAGDEELPDSEMHRIKAPEIDIANMRDPFESYLTVLEKQSKQRLEMHRSKETDHAPEPLEAFDLGALKLVAIMQMGANRAAMVENHEGKGYVVRTGSYIGRDNGRVVNITERDVEIVEDEFNEVGEIIQRKAILTLNEVNQ